MWLLDHNIPQQVRFILEKYGIPVETALYRSWEALSNGQLVSVAMKAGFKVILSRDRNFHEAAKRSLSTYPELALVLIVINQANAKDYCREFEKEWKRSPIKPMTGKLIQWPK